MPFRLVDLSQISSRHPVAVFHRFWAQAAEGGVVAPWSAFDPVDHPAILPWVLLLKAEGTAVPGAARSWRYAVCGTGCTQLFGFSYQGKLFGEGMPAEATRERMVEFDRAIQGKGAQFSHTELPIPEKDFVAVFRGVFPFASHGKEVDRLLVVLAGEGVSIG